MSGNVNALGKRGIGEKASRQKQPQCKDADVGMSWTYMKHIKKTRVTKTRVTRPKG